MSLRDRCPWCANWDDPTRCGHALEDGVLVPPLYMTRAYVQGIEVGARVSRWAMIENHSHQSKRLWVDRIAA